VRSDIPELSDMPMKAFSHYDSGEGAEKGFAPKPEGETILKSPKVNRQWQVDGPDAFPRDTDGEFKLLEGVARRLVKNPNVRGSIDLFSEKPPCRSCSGAVEQFNSLYPNVELRVFSEFSYQD
jgi:filamentous hemagglutinin